MVNTEFNNSQLQMAYPDGMENHWWNMARNEIIYTTVKKYLLEKEQMVEIGCGTGIVTNYLKNKKIKIIGVEPAISRSKIKSSGIVFGKNPENLPAKLIKKIKVIGLFDVLEHISDPEKFLKKCIKTFKNATLFIITVPAHMELWSNFDEFYGHFKRYNFDLIRKELQNVNLSVIEQKHFFFLPFILIWFQKKIGFNRKVALKAPKNAIQRILNLSISKMLLFEKNIPFSVPGSSLLAVAKIKR